MQEFLKEEMALRHWNVSRLAEACDVSIGLAAKWVSDNPRYHVRPSPTSCAKIAAALGVDLDRVLELAGHRAPSAATAEVSARSRAVQEQVERWIAAVGPENEEYFWRHLKAQGDSTVALIQGLGTAVNPDPDGAINSGVSASSKASERRRRRGNGGLGASYPQGSFSLASRRRNVNDAVAA